MTLHIHSASVGLRQPLRGRGRSGRPWLPVVLLALAVLPLSRGDGRVASRPSPYSATVQSRAVHFGLSGFEPDFDPLYRLVLIATLHDRRPAPLALANATLVLGAYLENFQPGTTPILPDLLHPNQVAPHLNGFLQGKAALVDAVGHPLYTGSLLAEALLGNQLHLVVTLDRTGAPDSAPSLRLVGALTLAPDGTQSGTLASVREPDRATLAADPVRAGHALNWQAIVTGLGVSLPPMRGTARGGHRPASVALDHTAPFAVAAALHPAAARPLPPPTTSRQSAALWGDGVALLSAVLLLALWRTRGRSSRAAPHPA